MQGMIEPTGRAPFAGAGLDPTAGGDGDGVGQPVARLGDWRPSWAPRRAWLPWVAYLAAFAAAYSQRALYFSNQHTKFLTGLARGGMGYLREDWLAHTIDPFPIFSALVEATWRFGAPWLFYLQFSLLVALYGLASLLIASGWMLDKSRRLPLWIFAALMLAVHAWFLRGNLSEWFPPGLGEQYMLGPYLQPSSFGVLLLLGLGCHLHGRRLLGIALIAASASLHPTYMIAAGVTALALALSTTWLERRWREALWMLVVFAVAIAPVFVYIATALRATDPSIQAEAHALLADRWIPRHAALRSWPFWSTFAILAMMGGGLLVTLRQRLGRTPLGLVLWAQGLLIACTLVVAWHWPNPTLRLIAPWRVSTILSPLAVILMLANLAQWIADIGGETLPRAIERYRLRPAALVLGLTLAVLGVHQLLRDIQATRARKTAGVCAFVAERLQPGELYLVHGPFRDFRLRTGAPVVATWKSHPTKDLEFLAWSRRVEMINAFYDAAPADRRERLVALQRRFGVTHVVMPRERAVSVDEFGEPLYHDEHFVLWALPEGDAPVTGATAGVGSSAAPAAAPPAAGDGL